MIFYAGCPLKVGDHNLGTLCVIDHKPKSLTEEQKNALTILAKNVATHLEMRQKFNEIAVLTQDLQINSDILEKLEETAKIGYWSLDAKTHTPRWSPGTYKIHGVPVDKDYDVGELSTFMSGNVGIVFPTM